MKELIYGQARKKMTPNKNELKTEIAESTAMNLSSLCTRLNVTFLC